MQFVSGYLLLYPSMAIFLSMKLVLTEINTVDDNVARMHTTLINVDEK